MTSTDYQALLPHNTQKRFQRVRDAHAMETIEDYVELIYQLKNKNGHVRSSDIAEHMGVSAPTVTRIIQRLDKNGYITAKPYQPIELREKGKSLAEFCIKRHEIVLDFLIRLGVPEDIANLDAEGMEHHISKETLQLLQTSFK